MLIHFLGTGAAEPDPARLNTSLLITGAGTPLLVDCSGSPGHAIQAAGVGLTELRDVILTHAHADHMYALPSLVHGLWLHGGVTPGKRLRIHGTTEVLETARTLVDAFALLEKRDAVVVEWNELHSGNAGRLDITLTDGWQAEYFPVSHGGLEAVGLRFSRSDRNLVYSGDALADELLTPYARSADVLIQDCGGGVSDHPGHPGIPSIARMIDGAPANPLILVHLPTLTTQEFREFETQLVGAIQGRSFLIPADGERFDVPF